MPRSTSAARRTITALLAATVAATGCGAGAADDTILVSAAASLTNAFAEIEAAYERGHPGVDVILNLAGSSTLRQQIVGGAPADVFASANTDNMDLVVDAGDAAGVPQVFATNRLQIAVPAGNPAGIEALRDLEREDLLVGLCAEAVPCGDFALAAFRNAGLVPSIDTNEPDVRSLLTKIEAGELDAGIVYATDVLAAGGAVEGVAIPADVNVLASYPIVALSGAPNPDGAAGFIQYVLSAEGRAILDRYGFGLP